MNEDKKLSELPGNEDYKRRIHELAEINAKIDSATSKEELTSFKNLVEAQGLESLKPVGTSFDSLKTAEGLEPLKPVGPEFLTDVPNDVELPPLTQVGPDGPTQKM